MNEQTMMLLSVQLQYDPRQYLSEKSEIQNLEAPFQRELYLARTPTPE